MNNTLIKRKPPPSSSIRASTTLYVKRCHGLGNVICLLPVLEKIHHKGIQVVVKTQKQWLTTFSALFPQYTWLADGPHDFIDLDSLTEDQPPTEHRTENLTRLRRGLFNLSA